MKTAKIFQNGRSQAVRLPKEFRLPGSEVYIKKAGNAVVLLPTQDIWQPLLDSLDKFSADYMEIREQPQPEDRERVFQ